MLRRSDQAVLSNSDSCISIVSVQLGTASQSDCLNVLKAAGADTEFVFLTCRVRPHADIQASLVASESGHLHYLYFRLLISETAPRLPQLRAQKIRGNPQYF
jgi:hypothetical protein